MNRYNNYHRHSHKSNVMTLDSITKNEEYFKRAVELGHDKVFTTEHGFQGDLFEMLTLGEQYGLQVVLGAECYYVKDRKEPDKSNNHIILVALNDDGVRDIQRIVSEANVSGFYYKPRIDHELLFSVNPNNIIVTTACIAGIWKYEDLVAELASFFGQNFFLEVQDHNVEAQKEMNRIILDMSHRYNIPIIHANDSHYIKPEDAKYRSLFLKAKGITYEEEDNFILDYPDYDEIVKRYEEQGVLTKAQIDEALENTLVFDACQPITMINKDVKLPSIVDNPNEELKKIINESWKKKKEFIPKEKREEYLKSIKYEYDIIEKTGMADYFILDHDIVQLAETKYGGTLTKTGRGCFTGDANVLTKDGYKEIKDIEIGEMVLTNDGTYNKVLQKMEYDIIEPMLKIVTKQNNKYYISTCTLDHKILIHRNNKNTFIEARNIKDGDLCCLPAKVSQNRNNNALAGDLEYNPIKILKITEPLDIKVYDIAVENHHNYVLNGMIVHNSAPSFYVTNLLGLTDIDRMKSPVTLFPTRFMSVERILGAKSLPDIDLNTADAEPFIKASKDILGERNCAWMIAWKPLQKASAFRLYCKAIGMDISQYNDIAKEIDSYEDDLHWGPIIKDSEPFVGVIESMAPSPCSMCLYYKPIDEEIGLIKVKDKIVCLLDGYNCDKYKYLKNDYLTTMVWGIIKDVCQMANISIPTIEELNQLLDDKTYQIYEKGLTCTINQADSNWATSLVMRYKPKSVADMSAFVAIIRPGCASLLQDFIDRKPYTTGIPQLDEILEDSGHRMIYQESIMKYLIWLGIPETGSYDIIKKIAKKKFKENELKELKEKLKIGWAKQVGKEEGFEETWQVVQDASKYSFNCIAGSTKIQRLGQKKSCFNPTIEEMYLIKNDKNYAIKTGHKDLYMKYNRCGYGNAYSMFEDNRIHKNKIIDIYYTGIQKIYRVKTKKGSYVDCTMSHKFPTPIGEKKLQDLTVGSELYTKGIYEKHPDDYRLTSYKNFDNSKFELHHINHDRTNNNRENLQWLCNSCHKKQHYKDGRIKVLEKGIPTLIDEIESITYLREDKVYDIEMQNPAHNFVSESGLVVSNCSHSLSYAYDSLYGAYLKSHYPLEYYTVTLNYYNGDEDRTKKLTEELKYFGIKLEKPRFRYSKDGYFFDKETNTIYKGTSSIKYLNKQVSDYLYSLRDMEFDSFSSFLIELDKNRTVDSRQMTILITLQFFAEFGKNKKLLDVFNLFKEICQKERKNISKDTLPALGITDDMVKSHCEKETAKQYMKIDAEAILKEYESKCDNVDLPIKEQMKYENEVLGYLSGTYPYIPKRYCYVTEIDTKYSPKVNLYCLNNGKMVSCKISKFVFEKDKIKKGDILECIKFDKKNKVKRENDKFVKTDEKEWWLSIYLVTNKMEAEELIKG